MKTTMRAALLAVVGMALAASAWGHGSGPKDHHLGSTLFNARGITIQHSINHDGSLYGGGGIANIRFDRTRVDWCESINPIPRHQNRCSWDSETRIAFMVVIRDRNNRQITRVQMQYNWYGFLNGERNYVTRRYTDSALGTGIPLRPGMEYRVGAIVRIGSHYYEVPGGLGTFLYPAPPEPEPDPEPETPTPPSGPEREPVVPEPRTPTDPEPEAPTPPPSDPEPEPGTGTPSAPEPGTSDPETPSEPAPEACPVERCDHLAIVPAMPRALSGDEGSPDHWLHVVNPGAAGIRFTIEGRDMAGTKAGTYRRELPAYRGVRVNMRDIETAFDVTDPEGWWRLVVTGSGPLEVVATMRQGDERRFVPVRTPATCGTGPVTRTGE